MGSATHGYLLGWWMARHGRDVSDPERYMCFASDSVGGHDMTIRAIKTKPDKQPGHPGFILGGWLSGKTSYLWMGVDNMCLGTLSGRRLYQLAKAIVKQFEGDKS